MQVIDNTLENETREVLPGLCETRQFAQGVWTFRRPFRLVGVNIGVTMTAVQLPQGELFVHSPVRLTKEVRDTLKVLGQVGYVIAPSTAHHLFIRDYGPEFPGSKLYGPRGLKTKRADVYFHGELESKADAAWSETVDQIEVQGLRSAIEEFVFFHKPSKTVIVTDLVFNMTRPHSTWEKTFSTLNGLSHGPACSRVFRLLIKDRQAFRRSIDQILAWKPERLIVGHGDPLHSGAERALREAFAWLK